ncbi:exported protein of unknown function [Acetoanaerobium sticklandii]|jgi:hypothetical protein|uniref:Uncharacterized protein n=1 Tax=Acetoanaerobium sticklandii (strain ATCC 12662 / DSM 519 / JCM 1433 / CCUG 9281 / NCIMB 10654 / HF) TaxID=499177 RepID=E3PWD8_ACESD|nr:hypothetical protein [Acetoanaerobium sticklandii]CBH20753.1 exported protein of unknown function [Acetoanaerobium sticklandii]
MNNNVLITLIAVLFIILISIQYTLNQILKVLREIRISQKKTDRTKYD